jgi:ribosomal protein S18 acetylase RimI-like enzyme
MDDPSQVLRDVSAAALVPAIEASLTAYQVSLARLPGAEVYDTPNLLWVSTGVSLDFYNGVYRSMLDPLYADAQIQQIIEVFRRRWLPMYWQVGPSARPLDLPQRLLAHGLAHEEDEPGMALDMLAMNEEFPSPPGLEIRRVEDEASLNAWVAVRLFGAPELIPLVQRAQAQLGLGAHLPWRYYLGSVAGKPVATAQLFFGAGVAAVHWVVTLREARHQGIGAAMTLAALREARAAGYRVAILTASPDGERIYRRIGFRDYGTISKYSWQIPAASPSAQRGS